MAKSINNIITRESLKQIDNWVLKFPKGKQQSAVLEALKILQQQNGGWLTTELMDALADYLKLPKISIYEVATFYSMYEHHPVGKYKICVCTNISCLLRGCNSILEYLEKKLNIKSGETTKCGTFSLKTVECLGACIGAPMLQIDDKYYENLTTEKIDNILAELKNKLIN